MNSIYTRPNLYEYLHKPTGLYYLYIRFHIMTYALEVTNLKLKFKNTKDNIATPYLV
jgi:hypothetical protein